jgi:hypothetical protein
MPLGFDPGEVISGVQCSLDEHLPDDKRIRLKLRVLTGRQTRQLSDLIEAAASAKKQVDELAKLHEALNLGIASWENCPQPFTDDGIDDTFSVEQMYSLARELPYLQFGGERSKKASRFAQRSAAAKSAKDAAAVSVTTPPTQPAP